jgi:uncharacterized protein YggE
MFTNADPSEAIRQARIEAVRDAMAKAKTLARAAGVDSGDILEISKQSFTTPPDADGKSGNEPGQECGCCSGGQR